MIVTILFFVLLAVYLILGLPLLLLVWLLKLLHCPLADRISQWYVVLACRIACLVSRVTVETEGLENLPKSNETVVYIMNHRSIFDVMVSYPCFPGITGYIAKDGLGKFPVFSWWLSAANCLFLDRSDIKKGIKTIEKGIENVKNGISMCIFPEGTRNRDRENKTSLLEFHGGAFKLAIKNDVPIIPIVLYNTSAAFEDHFPKITPATIKMIVKEPINTKDLDPKEKRFLPQKVYDIIQETLNNCEK